MHKLYLIGILLSISWTVWSQQEFNTGDKIFNFGATVGLKSSLPVIKSLSIDGEEAQDINTLYRVGYLTSVFCRINVDRIFLQPSFSWQYSSSEFRFTLPVPEDAVSVPYSQYRLKSTFHTLEVPVLVGYKIVKEGPYDLSLLVGPKIRYNYNTDFTFDFAGSMNRFSKNSNLFDVNIVTGVAVSIWRLFFDFSYEFGLNRKDSDFKNLNPNESTIQDITINQHVNVMSFSLGFLF